jgi:hypothetical protein
MANKASGAKGRREKALTRWRGLFGLEHASLEGAALESKSTSDAATPDDRIKQAREAMMKLVTDRFGGDPALIDQIDRLAISSEEAIAIISDTAEAPKATDDHLASLEAIVAFDGTRPSFLVKDNAIDFASSFNTGNWTADLAPYLKALEKFIACVGRVEIGEQHHGTAFLVTPTLAITNRHVAQGFVRFAGKKMVLVADAFVDFGREEWNGKRSVDRRSVAAVIFAGDQEIDKPLDHRKLDLAVLRLSPSSLRGNAGKRHLDIAGVSGDDYEIARFVAAVGYPAGARDYVPSDLKSKYADVLYRLLEGDGGAKRFAPGFGQGLMTGAGAAPWTATHDATTLNGNSGSPLVILQGGSGTKAPRAAGLHYGGQWGGERVNWAHLLTLTEDAVGYGGNKSFADFCQDEGIVR